MIRREAAKLLMNMNIVTDGEGYIYYNDILFAVFKYMLKDSIKINSSQKGQEIVRLAEQTTIQKL